MYLSNLIFSGALAFNTNHWRMTPCFLPFFSATDEVVVYGTNLEVYSNDAFLGFPTDVLGMEYYTVSHHPTTKECEFMLIGMYGDHDHVWP